MRHRIYLHIVWTTADREPTIDHARASFLVQTHLHVVVRIHPACVLSRLLQRWKGASAMLCRRDQIGDPTRPLRWAKGCSVTSVGPRALPAVMAYVENQPMHHPRDAIVEPAILD
jgi:REP element-mobilizing transposase RayT